MSKVRGVTLGRAGWDPVHAGDTPAPGLYARHERVILGGLAVGAVVLAWEATSRSGLVNPILVSSPIRIVTTGMRLVLSGELGEHLAVSGSEFALGYLIAVLTAVPLGLMAGWYPRLNFIVDPFLSALYATPRVALIPLLILWAGVGLWSKVAVVFLGVFFPVCMNTLAGVRTVDDSHLKLARSFQGGDLHVLRTIVIPHAVPFVLAGLRLGVGRALVGVVVAELFAASAGVGFLIAVAGATFQTDRLFVGVAILGGFGMLCNELLSRAERRVERWRPRAGVGA